VEGGLKKEQYLALISQLDFEWQKLQSGKLLISPKTNLVLNHLIAREAILKE
jgi:hypothetical protein